MVHDLSDLRLCSINTATLGFQAPIRDVIEAVARAGFGQIAPWRREIEGDDVAEIARHIRDAGLSVSGYCRSTYIPAATRPQFMDNIKVNKRAIADAGVLGAANFVMVVGSLPEGSKDLASARSQVQDASALLAEFGKSVGVRIALEPLHPVYAADRSCLTLLSEASDICDAVDSPWLGVLIDVYHCWWDPYLEREIIRAGAARRIFGFHVCDWLRNTQDVLNDRGMMGDGVIDIRGIRRMLEAAEYSGPVECEIFSAANWWKRPMDETLLVCAERFTTVA